MSSTSIVSVHARQVFSGRIEPAIEATVCTESGKTGTAHVVAGLSVGTHEVPFVYDGGTQWRGRGVQNAVESVNNTIGPSIVGMDSSCQLEIDQKILNLKGKDTKSILGGNAIAAVSAAVLKAGASALGIPLYQHIGGSRAVTLPCASYGCISGGIRYSEGLRSGSKPTYSFIAHAFDCFSNASYALWEVFTKWEELMSRKWGLRSQESSPYYTSCGFFSVPKGVIESDRVLWDFLSEIIASCGYEGRIGLQADLAADCYYNRTSGTYNGLFDSKIRSRDEQIDLIVDLVRQYPFIIIEDPLQEDDFEGHTILTEKTGIQIVGDDLFSTDPQRVKYGISKSACNTVLLKVNQIGSIGEALDMVQVAYDSGYGVMPCSSRGEGIDICDYSVGINAGTIRESSLGTPGSRFLEIELELGSRAVYAGTAGIKGWKFRNEGKQ